MRNLTVTRHASAVGALHSVKIYIEDRAVPEILICGVPCRKLGAVKNGKSATFKIPEKEAKVFAIAYMVSKIGSNQGCSLCKELISKPSQWRERGASWQSSSISGSSHCY